MLGRKDYTSAEIDRVRTMIDHQLTAYDEVVARRPVAERASFDAGFFNLLLLALDRPFVHRIRPVTGKDGNALNEVEMLCDSIINHQGILQPSKVIKLDPSTSVSGIDFGDNIHLTRDQCGRLVIAFFEELETRFLNTGKE